MTRRIVLTSLGSFGDVYPYIGLGLGLKARGHDVVLAMPSYYRQAVETEGLGFHPVRPDVDPGDRATIRRIMDPARGTDFLVKELLLPSLRDSYEDLSSAVRGADLLVTHPITFAGPIIAQIQGLPWVSSVLAPMSFFSRHDIPVFPPVPWNKELERIPGVGPALFSLARFISRPWGRPVYELRRELGLPRGDHPVFEGQHSPTLVLALFSKLLAEPQPDWPPNTRITGAIPYNGPQPAEALPPAIEQLLDSHQAPVVFTLGSSAVGAAGGFYRESIEAVRRLGLPAVLLAGSHPENRPAERLPANVVVESHVRHATLFPRASIIVHQGGIGTLHQALRAGRPTLVVPFAHDQPDNAHRVQRLGVSRTLFPKRYTAGQVVKELTLLREDPNYAVRAAAVGEQVRAEDGVKNACDAIEEVLARAHA